VSKINKETLLRLSACV